jgi:VWFA-related protein
MRQQKRRALLLMSLGFALAVSTITTSTRSSEPPARPDAIHVALILGTNTMGQAPSGLPVSVIKALSDASGVLAFKRFELLDQAVVRCEGTGREIALKGPRDRGYRLNLSFPAPGASATTDYPMAVRLTGPRPSDPQASAVELVRTDLTARVGETVVVGTSRPVRAAGDQALLLLVTPLSAEGARAFLEPAVGWALGTIEKALTASRAVGVIQPSSNVHASDRRPVVRARVKNGVLTVESPVVGRPAEGKETVAMTEVTEVELSGLVPEPAAGSVARFPCSAGDCVRSGGRAHSSFEPTVGAECRADVTKAIQLLVMQAGGGGKSVAGQRVNAPDVAPLVPPERFSVVRAVLLQASNTGGPMPAGLDSGLAKALEDASRVGPYKRFEVLDQGLIASGGAGLLPLRGPGARRFVLTAEAGDASSGDEGALSLRLIETTEPEPAGDSSDVIRAEYVAKTGQTVMVFAQGTPPAGDRPTLVLVVTPVSQAGPSQANTPRPTFRADVDVERLDLSVLDRDGHPVRGLSADDFVVLEDGRPQSIVAFSSVDIQDAGEPAAGWLRDVASDVATNRLDVQRMVVIVMDDAMTGFDAGTAEIARKTARAVIDRLGANDLGAVVFTLRGRSQNFTRDRRLLTAAVESFVPKSAKRVDPYDAAFYGVAPPVVTEPRTPFQESADGAWPAPCAYGAGRNCVTDTLMTVAAVLENAPVGRKSVILIAHGLPLNLSRPDNRHAMGDFVDVREAFYRLQSANANVYAFDPEGLSGQGLTSLSLDSLTLLAENTGGRVVSATNAPWEHVSQVFLENSSYYLLGIRPAGRVEDDRFRQLTVTVRKPDLTVRVRPGYFARAAMLRQYGRASEPSGALDKAFGSALPSGTLPLDVSIAPFALPDRTQAVVAVTVGVGQPAFGDLSVEKLELRTGAFDDAFIERATVRQTVDMVLRPNGGGRSQTETHSRLTLKPGRYEIRVAAEALQAAGGVFASVEIPDFSTARVSLSGLVLGRPRPAGSDLLADVLPVLPTAARTFAPTRPITAFLRVYQGGQDVPRPITVRARILDASSRPAFEETRELNGSLFGAARAADYRLDLPLARLGAGEFLLTVEATDGKVSVSRDVRFTIARP